MGFHHNKQPESSSSINYSDTPWSGIQSGVLAARTCQRLFKTAGVWYAYDHTRAGAHVAITRGYYDPPFCVRYIKVEGSNRQVKYDMPWTGDNTPGEQLSNQNYETVDLFAVEILHRIQMTRVYLDADTTVDAISLYY